MYSSSSPILDAGQRASRYWFADGLPTLAAGLGVLLFSVIMLYPGQRDATPLSLAVSIVAVVLYGTVVLRRREIVDWLKTRITYPRTGYVRPPHNYENTPPFTVLSLSTPESDAARQEQAQRVQSDRTKNMVLLIPLVLLVQFGVMFVESRWVFTAVGLVVAAAFWVSRKDHGLSSIVLFGFPVLGFCMTIFFVASRLTGAERLGYFLAGGGLLLMLDGAIALIRYIVRQPAAKAPRA